MRGGVDAVRASLPPATSIMLRRESAAPIFSEDPALQVERYMERVSECSFGQTTKWQIEGCVPDGRRTGASAWSTAFVNREQ